MTRGLCRSATRASTLAVPILALALLMTRNVSAERAPDLEPLQLDRLIEIALEENPELRGLRSRIGADRAKVPQARTMPDPMVGLSFSDVLNLDSSIMFEAKQRVPWPGKLRLLSEAAALSADRTVTEYTEKAYEVAAAVKTAYYELYFVEKSIEVALANKDLLADFVTIAEAKYSVGFGLQQDVLRAQVAESRILDDLLKLRQRRAAVRARLNALLNRPPEAPLRPAADFTRHRVTLPQSALEQIARQRRAALKGNRLGIERAQVLRDLAVRNLKPNFELRAGVAPKGAMGARDTTVSFGVMFELPLYHRTKQDRAIEQRAAEVEAARRAYEARETAILARIEDRLAALRRADREVELFRTGIIPQAELSLESARAGYQVNKVDFLALLDNQISLYNDLRQYYRALTDYEKGVAELERTIGTPLETSEVQP